MTLRDSKGLAILQVLMLLILIGVLEYGIVQSLLHYQTSRKQIQLRSDRLFITKQFSTLLSAPKSLLESATLTSVNQELKACLLGGPVGACTSNCCNNNVTAGFYLVDPVDNNADVNLKRRLTGISTNPIYYLKNGAWCPDQTVANCAFKILTNFTPRCPGSTPNCDHAEHLKIEVLVEPTNNFQLIKNELFTTYYFVNRNYQPKILPITPPTVNLGGTTTINVIGDPGHPSEIQNFIYSLCKSNNTSLVDITCFPFGSGQSLVQINGLGLGTTQLEFQINDGGLEHNLSNIYTLNVEVVP